MPNAGEMFFENLSKSSAQNVLAHRWFDLEFQATESHSKTFMPEETIKGYIAQARKMPQFSEEIIFRGDEFFAASAFAPRDYIPRLLNFAWDKNSRVAIKTTAAWMNAGYSDKILRDLQNITKRPVNRKYYFEISMPVNRYYPGSATDAAKIISAFARSASNASFHISFLPGAEKGMLGGEYRFGDKYVLDDRLVLEMLQRIKWSGLSLAPVLTEFAPSVRVNGRTLVSFGRAESYQWGSAANLPDWLNRNPAFDFKRGVSYKIAFNAAGQAGLGGLGPYHFCTNWEEGKSLAQIMAELLGQAVHAEAEQSR